jgi:hypothetical protein
MWISSVIAFTMNRSVLEHEFKREVLGFGFFFSCDQGIVQAIENRIDENIEGLDAGDLAFSSFFMKRTHS